MDMQPITAWAAFSLVIATIMEKIITSIAKWSEMREKKKQTPTVTTAEPASTQIKATADTSASSKLLVVVEVGSRIVAIVSLGLLLWLFFGTPPSDPHWFNIFLAMLVVCALRPR